MLDRIGAIVRKEFGHLFADPKIPAFILMIPIFNLLVFAYAINTVVDDLPTVVYDASADSDSRAFVTALRTSGFFDIRRYVSSREEAVAAVDAGEARVAVVLPPELGDRVLRGQTAQAQLLVDGSDPSIAQAALFAANSITQAHSANVVTETLSKLGRGGETGGIELRPVVLYNPGLLSVVFLVPALIGFILQDQALSLTALAIATERERGTLEQLMVTPVRSWEVMVAKCIPYTLMACICVGTSLAVSRYWFGIELAGSLALLAALSLLFLLSSLSAGLLVSTVSKTAQQARLIIDVTSLPTILLTGFVFPRESMPAVFQYLGLLIPLTHFLEILRGIMLKGVGIDVLWPQAALLAFYGVLFFTLGALRFRKQEE
jgi:drug efflux transport system permease protein